MAGIVLEGVSRVYPGGVVAVHPSDLEVRDGELLVLVGPSGSGKTTMLRMIAGLEPATAGRILLGGRVVNDVAPKDRDIAMVFQNQALYPHLSVYKNLAFGLQLRYPTGWPRRCWQRAVRPAKAAETDRWRREIDERVRQAAGSLGIAALLERMPSELSGGERQRVALGRALVRRPAAFLFDEPLSNLDAQLRVELRRELKRLHRQLGATMVYVTHDQVEALTLGDRIVVLCAGVVEQIGTPEEVYDNPANRFVAGFIGMPPMNLLEGSWVQEESGARSWFAGRGWTMVAEGLGVAEDGMGGGPGAAGPVVLGLRAEDVCLVRGAESPPGSSEVRVTMVEPLGNTTIVHLEPAEATGAAWLQCRAERHCGLKPGDRAQARFDLRRAHWFDARTGRNLRPPKPTARAERNNKMRAEEGVNGVTGFEQSPDRRAP